MADRVGVVDQGRNRLDTYAGADLCAVVPAPGLAKPFGSLGDGVADAAVVCCSASVLARNCMFSLYF